MAGVKLILRFGILFSRSVGDACKVNDKYLVVVVVVRDIVFFRRSILCSV